MVESFLTTADLETPAQLDNTTPMEGEPVPFIEIGEDGSFAIATQAMTHLEQMKDKNLAVIVVGGPARSGKSFLASRLLGRMEAFKIGRSVDSTTQGIWMWSQPVPLSEDVDALVLDCEGLNSEDRSYDIDVKLFALCLLMSSQFVFNSVGTITDSTLEDMSVILLMANEIRINPPEVTLEEGGK